MPKPSKPTADFPLFAHNNGQWAKKIKGKLHYFGPWNDPKGALARYLADDTQAGCQPQVSERTNVTSTGKPDKPRKDFPLYAHSSGRWAKKVRGETRFFGPWDDPQEALNKWLDQKDDLLAGRESRKTGEGLAVCSLVNQFLKSKEALVENGELTRRHWEDCKRAGIKLVKAVGRNRLVVDLHLPGSPRSPFWLDSRLRAATLPKCLQVGKCDPVPWPSTRLDGDICCVQLT